MYDYTSNILQAKNPNEFFEIYLVDTGTSKENKLEDEDVTYVSKATYHKPKQKFIYLKDLEKCLQIEKEGHRMDPEWNYKKRKKIILKEPT